MPSPKKITRLSRSLMNRPRARAPHEHSWHVLLWEGRPPCLPTNHLARITRRKTGRHGGRPSPNFSGLLAGKCVHVAPKKGPPFLDARARMSRTAAGLATPCEHEHDAA